MDPTLADSEARLEALGDPSDDPQARVDALLELSWALRFVDRDRSGRLAAEARELSRSIGYVLGQARAARSLCMTLTSSEMLRDLLALGEEAKVLFDEAGDKAGSAGSRDFLAGLLELVGDLSGAMELAQEALALAREIDDAARQGYALCNVGGVLAASGDAEAAKARWREALELFEQADDALGIGRICQRLSTFYREENDLEQALKYANRLYEVSARSPSPSDRAAALDALAELQMLLENFDLAEQLFRQSLDSYHDETMRALAGIAARLNLGRLLVRRGAHAEAEAEITELLTRIAAHGKWHDIEARAHQVLADSRAARGDRDAEVFHLREVVRLQQLAAEHETQDKLGRFEARAEMKAAQQAAELHRLRFVELARMQSQLVEAEKMAQLGVLAAGTAHELGSPLGVLRSNLGLFANGVERLAVLAANEPELRSEVERIRTALSACRRTSEQAVARLAAVAERFGRFAQLDLAEQRTFDVTDGLTSALELLRPNLPPGISLEGCFEPVPHIEGWPKQLNQAFLTVLMNAIEAIDDRGVVKVWTAIEAGEVVVRIRDTGRGMTDEERTQLFDVGWSAAGDRTKMRLGLAAVQATVQRHDGSVRIESAVGSGTTFEFRLPLPSAYAG